MILERVYQNGNVGEKCFLSNDLVCSSTLPLKKTNRNGRSLAKSAFAAASRLESMSSSSPLHVLGLLLRAHGFETLDVFS